MSLPYIPWYHGSFLASTVGWTLEERAAYFLLLGAQWESGPLPVEFSRLATIVGVPVPKMKTLWVTVGRKFTTTAAGFVNARLEQHREKSLRLVAARRLGAEITNAKRWGQVVPIPVKGARGDH